MKMIMHLSAGASKKQRRQAPVAGSRKSSASKSAAAKQDSVKVFEYTHQNNLNYYRLYEGDWPSIQKQLSQATITNVKKLMLNNNPAGIVRILLIRKNLEWNVLCVAIQDVQSKKFKQIYQYTYGQEDYILDSKGEIINSISFGMNSKWPIDINLYKITDRFGVRIHPRNSRKISIHKGVDLSCKKGTPIYSIADGIVYSMNSGGWGGGYGNYIIIQHNYGYSTLYAHCSKLAPNLKVGNPIKAGDLIGFVGNTGFSTGCHLHFEIRHCGKHLDPEKTYHIAGGNNAGGTIRNQFMPFIMCINAIQERILFGTIAKVV